MKIKRKLNQNEITIMRLNGVLNGITQYLKEKGLFEDCQSWFKIQLEGDGKKVMQGNGEEGREKADEGKDGGCGHSEGSCCKEGKEEIKEISDGCAAADTDDEGRDDEGWDYEGIAYDEGVG